jgi:predicted 2-oxoglutarate/Fe(II)-dependent dioxygenase YbiX
MVSIEHVISREQCGLLVAEFRRIAGLTGVRGVRRRPWRVEIPAVVLAMMSSDAARVLSDARAAAFDALERSYFEGSPHHIDFTLATEMRPGDLHELHSDSERFSDGRWVPNHTAWRSYSAIVYLNDGEVDFSGGVLSFPDHHLTVVPRAGKLIGFPSGHEFSHAVSEVTLGRRYTIAVWVTQDPRHREEWSWPA